VALFARENELRSVYDLVARSGTGGALVLRGEAGVGKTALLSEIISASRRADIRVLSTAGVSLQMQQPFAGLAHLMRSVLNDPELVGRYPAAWDTVRAAIGGEDVPIGSPFSVAYAVLDVLSACSARQRVLLVVDDAGWVDEQSWGVLSFVGRRIDFDQIVLIMAVRDGVEGDRRLRDSSLPTLRIEPLSDESAAALLDRVAPGLEPRIRSRILLEAGGNPLGLLELSDEARRRGPAAMPETFMPLPDRLEQTFAGLVSELPRATRSLLVMAAFNDSHSLQETLDAAALAAWDTPSPLPHEQGVSGHAFSCSTRKPQTRLTSSTCRTPPSQKTAHPPGLSRDPFDTPVSMSSVSVSTRQQRFTRVRLPDPHLTPLGRLFLIAHHDGHQPTQHEVVWSLPPPGDPEGPKSFIFRAASLQKLDLPNLLHVQDTPSGRYMAAPDSISSAPHPAQLTPRTVTTESETEPAFRCPEPVC
jgi:hypothetical protein